MKLLRKGVLIKRRFKAMGRIMLLSLLTVFVYNYGLSQSKTVSKLIPKTIEIMNYLHIRVRDSLKQDGVLQIQPLETTNNPNYKNASAVFARSKSGRTLDSNGDAIKYSHPIIYIDASIDTLIKNKGHQSKFKKFYGKTILVHELTHFLQKTVYITYGSRTKENDPAYYFRLPDENEAWAVSAYYFLKHYSPEILKNIPQNDVSSQEYRLALYNAMAKIFSENGM
jgi:hypothetical protein